MITRDANAFFAFAASCAADFGPPTARAAFLVTPDGFARAEQSASDNAYMAEASAFDPQRDLSYRLTMTVRETSMTTRGCIVAGLLCKDMGWTRLSGE